MESRHGLTLIELLVVLAILSVFILVGIWAWKKQLMKGRDAKRKADLKKAQNVLEDYFNDNSSYPERLEGFQDPINSAYFNYFYSFNYAEARRSWYKIYTRLENEDDPIIAEAGCPSGCGPSDNYNYWVSSANVTQVAQILPAEDWWPSISPPPGASPTPTVSPPTGTPTPTPTPTFPPGTPTPEVPTPTTGVPTPTPTPTPIPGCIEDDRCNVWRALWPTECGAFCPGSEMRCVLHDLNPMCCLDSDCQ